MATSLSPCPIERFVDNNGNALVGGKLFIYLAGTTTKTTSYTDSGGGTPQSNPVIMNTRGEPEGSGGQSLGIWLASGVAVKMVLAPAIDTDPPTNPFWTLDQINPSGGGSAATGSAAYPTLAAAVAATIPAGTTYVTTSGYYSVADGGGGSYLPSSAGSGPGKFQSADGAWWKLSAAKPNVKQFGAKGDGSTNDQPAFANALSYWGSTGGIITVPDATYALSSGITIPDFTYLQGDVWFPNLEAIKGVQLLFATAVATCVQLGTGLTNNPSGIENITINRTGTPPSGSVGLYVAEGQDPVVQNVGSINHAICMYWKGSLTGGTGITCHPDMIRTAAATDAHVVVDTWPELFFSRVRTGCNGGVDQNCNAHLRITGGGTGGDGPNGVRLTNWQMNQGQNTATHGVEFVNLSDTASNALEFVFVSGHMEGIGSYCLYTDASVTYLNRLNFTAVEFNSPSAEFWNLNAATQLTTFALTGCWVFTNTFTYAPTIAPNAAAISDCYLPTTALTIPTNSTFGISTTTFGSLTLAGAGTIVIGQSSCIGSYVNNATGKVVATDNTNISGSRNWTPQFQFGGANVSITGTFDGEYEWMSADTCRIAYNCAFTSKGSSAGNATISNLPATSNATYGTAAGTLVPYAVNMTSLTGALLQYPTNGSTVLNFAQTGAGGVSVITNSDFTNTSVLNGQLVMRTT